MIVDLKSVFLKIIRNNSSFTFYVSLIYVFNSTHDNDIIPILMILFTVAWYQPSPAASCGRIKYFLIFIQSLVCSEPGRPRRLQRVPRLPPSDCQLTRKLETIGALDRPHPQSVIRLHGRTASSDPGSFAITCSIGN